MLPQETEAPGLPRPGRRGAGATRDVGIATWVGGTELASRSFMNHTRLLAFSVVLLTGCWDCPDCCPPGDHRLPREIRCSLVRNDGGAAIGVVAKCTASDAGAITDSTGSFGFMTSEITCGFAAGSFECGSVQFVEDGGLLRVSFSDVDGGDDSVPASSLTGGSSCQLVAR